ncbi:hypothetical protein BBFGKLBO_03075 [Synechococcus sp. CBW1107]|nr:hypothetical protein BBFGKLBO_03075 [Synechococcus sp. CBW1107]
MESQRPEECGSGNSNQNTSYCMPEIRIIFNLINFFPEIIPLLNREEECRLLNWL